MTDHNTSLRPGGGICVAVAAPDTESALSAVRPIRHEVDVVEVRLDGMRECNLLRLSQEIDRPLLFTNRPAWEGGLCMKSEEERLTPLLDAVEYKAAYVDLELKTSLPLRERLLDKIRRSRTQLIVSYHDFEKTPDDARLAEILHEQRQSGAHIGKIVTMAHDYLDVLRVLHLQCAAKSLDFPLIAFCMGDEGKISRIITLVLGGYMTYAALDEQQATAPGQLSVGKLKTALALLSDTNKSA
ncbi:MAG: type I 3-dehydroquinate dehydratase [Desulforhopalus sp.]